MQGLKIIFLFFLLNMPLPAADLEITNGRIPEAPPVSPVMAGYMILQNHSDKDVTITSMSSPAFARVEIHSMSMKDGMMHMRQLERFTIPARGKRRLEPGGYHLMLVKPEKPLRAGNTVDITFGYQDNTRQKFRLAVEQ